MSIEDDIAFLERVPTLAILGHEALRILAIGAESRYVHHGEVLFNAGDPADAGYVIQEGSFSLDGDKVHLLFLLVSPPDRPGDHLRALGLLPSRARSVAE